MYSLESSIRLIFKKKQKVKYVTVRVRSTNEGKDKCLKQFCGNT
jgi:hypothetical protein